VKHPLHSLLAINRTFTNDACTHHSLLFLPSPTCPACPPKMVHTVLSAGGLPPPPPPSYAPIMGILQVHTDARSHI
jgi:hypothetical protein